MRELCGHSLHANCTAGVVPTPRPAGRPRAKFRTRSLRGAASDLGLTGAIALAVAGRSRHAVVLSPTPRLTVQAQAGKRDIWPLQLPAQVRASYRVEALKTSDFDRVGDLGVAQSPGSAAAGPLGRSAGAVTVRTPVGAAGMGSAGVGTLAFGPRCSASHVPREGWARRMRSPSEKGAKLVGRQAGGPNRGQQQAALHGPSAVHGNHDELADAFLSEDHVAPGLPLNLPAGPPECLDGLWARDVGQDAYGLTTRRAPARSSAAPRGGSAGGISGRARHARPTSPDTGRSRRRRSGALPPMTLLG